MKNIDTKTTSKSIPEDSGINIIELRSEEFQEILGSVPPWILRWGIVVIAIIALLILAGSAIFKYPDTIQAQMTLTSTTPANAIVAKTSGKLQELLVEDNQHVEQKQYLAVVENPAATTDILFLKNYLSVLLEDPDSVTNLPPKELKLGNLQSLYSSFYINIFEYMTFKQLEYYPKKIEIMKLRIQKNEEQYKNLFRQRSIVEEQLSISKKQYQRDSSLHKKTIFSDEEFEKTQSQYLQARLSKENMQSSLENMEMQIVQMKESLLDVEHQYIDQKNTLETQLKTSANQLLNEIQVWEMAYVLQAQVNGKVTFTHIWVENQNVTAGLAVFNVVPDQKGEYIGKALLPLARSGKVKTGQKVNIRFNNFPDSEFGMVRGIVKNISLIPSKEQNISNYVIEIRFPEGLTTTYKKELPFLPEMEAQADIITEDLSLLERFFMPLRKIFTENL